MTTFADTSALYAVLVAEDAHHAEAAGIWRALLTQAEHVVTTNYVVVEACAILHRRLGPAAVRALREDILPAVGVEWVDAHVHAVALAAAGAGSRAGPSLVDWASFEFMRRAGLRRAFAFDAHSASQGFEIVTEPEP